MVFATGVDNSIKTFLLVCKDCGVSHDVVTQKNGSAVLAREVGIIRQYRGCIATSGLAKVGNNVVHADRYS